MDSGCLRIRGRSAKRPASSRFGVLLLGLLHAAMHSPALAGCSCRPRWPSGIKSAFLLRRGRSVTFVCDSAPFRHRHHPPTHQASRTIAVLGVPQRVRRKQAQRAAIASRALRPTHAPYLRTLRIAASRSHARTTLAHPRLLHCRARCARCAFLALRVSASSGAYEAGYWAMTRWMYS